MAAKDNGTTPDDARDGGPDAERRVKDFAARAEQVARERAGQLRERARDYYDEAYDRFDTAQRYVVERVQEKPLQSTLAAVGIGVIIGLLLGGGRRR
jgi:ElaB/YqjD/DUF883 family membrane-anchored ribosome-binding protein